MQRGGRRARERPVSRRRALLAALAACAALAGCGSAGSGKKYLDMARVRHAIERSIMQQRHLVSRVECPPREPEVAGRKFASIATTPSSKHPSREVKTAFLVTERNADGRVSYVGE
jgi:hypothetical protein